MIANTTSAPGQRGNAEQLATDRELYEQLVADRFTGPRFEQLREELWLYGWRVMRAWMRDGSVIERCAERNITFSAPYTEVEEMMRRVDIRDEIGHNCVSNAITAFMLALGTEYCWRPHKGATMRTYLIGACLFAFRDAYRRWATGYRRRLDIALAGIWPGTLPVMNQPSHGLDPGHMLVLRETLNRILDGASKEERAICELILSYDATQEQIAEQLGTTRKAVERRLARLRARAVALAVVELIIRPSVRTAAAR
ncbi:hypothetical protein [Streptomyces sp. NPDC002187]|uniref:hypothetical protein n=1 Tax=Streptomyces sp. NPDC002187 TaxID=3364637 RepID=UPI00369AA440